jgi:hypothetical protein
MKTRIELYSGYSDELITDAEIGPTSGNVYFIERVYTPSEHFALLKYNFNDVKIWERVYEMQINWFSLVITDDESLLLFSLHTVRTVEIYTASTSNGDLVTRFTTSNFNSFYFNSRMQLFGNTLFFCSKYRWSSKCLKDYFIHKFWKISLLLKLSMD